MPSSCTHREKGVWQGPSCWHVLWISPASFDFFFSTKSEFRNTVPSCWGCFTPKRCLSPLLIFKICFKFCWLSWMTVEPFSSLLAAPSVLMFYNVYNVLFHPPLSGLVLIPLPHFVFPHCVSSKTLLTMFFLELFSPLCSFFFSFCFLFFPFCFFLWTKET